MDLDLLEFFDVHFMDVLYWKKLLAVLVVLLKQKYQFVERRTMMLNEIHFQPDYCWILLQPCRSTTFDINSNLFL